MSDPNGTDAQQTNYQSNQNFDPDVAKMFKHFVTGGHTPDDNETGQNVGIDDIRGQISIGVTGQTTQNLINALNITPTTTTPALSPNTATPVTLAQESRCHAFYRIIGFPVVNADKSDFYNPGLDIIYAKDQPNRSMTLGRKIIIAQAVGAQFEAISAARENYQAAAAQIFSNPTSLEASVLALTSGTSGANGTTNIRKFTQPFLQSTDPFDFSVANQSYSKPGDIKQTYCLVGGNKLGPELVALLDFQATNADPSLSYKPNYTIGGYKIMSQHQHVIKPFIVDPRIDFSIWASESKSIQGVSRRVAVPFVPDASFLKTGETAKAERPLIEKVITDRFSSFTTDQSGPAVSEIVDQVKAIKNIQAINIGNVTIGNIFSGQIYKVSQQQAFAQYLSTIQALMFKLADAANIIRKRQGDHYWLPEPSVTGPEGGSGVKPVQVSSQILTMPTTPHDFDIIAKQAQVILSSVTSTITQSTATPDPGGFTFSNYKLTFDSSTSDAQGDLSTQSQDMLDMTRTKFLTEANDALQIVEMIMGEFSGLGLADIVAIMGALYVMQPQDLLGFLDVDAYARAQTILGPSLLPKSDITTTMTNFASIVNGFYQVMDQIFQDFNSNNATNL
jgi:hypothetical protein